MNIPIIAAATVAALLLPATASANGVESRRAAQADVRHQVIESYNVSAPVSAFCKPPGTSWSDRVSLYYGAHRWTCAWAAASSDRCYSGETLYGEVSITGSRDPSIFYYKVLKPARCV